MTPDLRGKVVLITGAAGGLGRTFALAFSGAGAQVAVADVNGAGAQETAELIRQAGGQALGLQVNVSDEASTLEMARAVRAEFGGLDALINNASLYAGLERLPFTEIDPAVWDWVMGVNLKGPWLCARAVTPLLRERGAGRIVNIASATVMSGSPLWAHYVASKGGVIALTRVLARELGDDGITVNAVAPGFTLTEASLGLMEDAASYGVGRGALKRAQQPGDLIGAALFFASDASAFITGQTLVVDGGRQFL
ncbi:NAD(P)-dependent dehydrogenase, short-chain alcohol dehydrogenase family [Deinococcus reticulitermitis]|uniref:NAD(P)-dependent dehydrogenase, short-chain alcohol dehydrogenase family n=1 Tax=Deinococcus reticulitermitis TaxID=856736 RepID=A0A1H6SBD8_9DEIO|nr:SDR family oxidoreductase [Deinococcus reticulitermitis]SEI60722.1 NAD(P)-dependent dehydrogenase, short-chain alcohol dehydrogenase family [Deinococcus reticulitermitis]